MAASLLALTRAATGTLFNSSFCESLPLLTQVACNGGLSESLLVFAHILSNCSFYESLTGSSWEIAQWQLLSWLSHGQQLGLCSIAASMSLSHSSHW